LLLVYHLRMLLFVDLDGVVYRGSEPVPGIGALLTARHEAGDTIVYVTNNSFLRRSEYRARIESCGAPFSEERIVTAASTVAARFAAEGRRRILVYGAEGLADEIRSAGGEARRTGEFVDQAALIAWSPDGVTVGLDRASTWHDLAIAASAVRGGAALIVPNRDATYPDPDGLVPGTGAAVAALEVASGVHATAVGKPAPDLLIAAAAAVGAAVTSAVMIGDSTATDITAANAAGCRSILLLTGVTSVSEVKLTPVAVASFEHLPIAQRPTRVALDATALAAILAEWSQTS